MRASFLILLVACTEPAAPTVQAPVEAVPAPVVDQPLPARPLRLGRPPHLAGATRGEYEPLAQHLAAVLGHPIEVVVTKSYEEVVEKLASGKLDLGLCTPFVYVKAKDRVPGLRLLASLLGEGAPQYVGYVVVRSDSRLASLSDLRGKRFAFVDPDSASGYLFPRALLADAGLDPARDFGSVVMAGDHREVVHRILAGTVDAGAVSSTTFHHMRDEAVANRLRIIAKTDPIPLDAFVAQPGLPEGAAAKLREALLAISARTPEGRAVLTGITTTNGFVAGDDHLYDPVRAVAAKLKASSN